MSAKSLNQSISRNDSGTLLKKSEQENTQLELGILSNLLIKRNTVRKIHTPEQIAKELSVVPNGKLYWIRPKRGRQLNREAGSLTSHGYLSIRIDGITYYAHQIAWCLYYGEWPTQEVDHIDRNRTNNCKANLREASRKENALNVVTKLGKLRNIYPTPTGKYQVRPMRDYVSIYLGTFDTIEEAILVRDAFTLEPSRDQN